MQGCPSSPGSKRKVVTKAAGPSISVAKGKLKPSAKESGACGLEDMPAEVLTTIAQHIDPKT